MGCSCGRDTIRSSIPPCGDGWSHLFSSLVLPLRRELSGSLPGVLQHFSRSWPHVHGWRLLHHSYSRKWSSSVSIQLIRQPPFVTRTTVPPRPGSRVRTSWNLELHQAQRTVRSNLLKTWRERVWWTNRGWFHVDAIEIWSVIDWL